MGEALITRRGETYGIGESFVNLKILTDRYNNIYTATVNTSPQIIEVRYLRLDEYDYLIHVPLYNTIDGGNASDTYVVKDGQITEAKTTADNNGHTATTAELDTANNKMRFKKSAEYSSYKMLADSILVVRLS